MPSPAPVQWPLLCPPQRPSHPHGCGSRGRTARGLPVGRGGVGGVWEPPAGARALLQTGLPRDTRGDRGVCVRAPLPRCEQCHVSHVWNWGCFGHPPMHSPCSVPSFPREEGHGHSPGNTPLGPIKAPGPPAAWERVGMSLVPHSAPSAPGGCVPGSRAAVGTEAPGPPPGLQA